MNLDDHLLGHGKKSSFVERFFGISTKQHNPNFRSCLSCVVTARIFLLFDLSSAVQIYVSYIYIHLFILHGYITNSKYDKLPVGLIAELVEHCTGRGHGFESRSSLNFFQAFFSQLLKLRSNCEDLSSI